MTDVFREETTEVFPGPCTDGHCPEPTEIVCIKTNKVFDFVFQQESRDECFDVPTACPNPVSVNCRIDTTRTTCQEVGTRVPVPNSGGLFTVTLLIRVFATINVVDRSGTVCPIDVVLPIVKAVNLCAPSGTSVECDVTAICTCALTTVGTASRVCCAFQLCLVISAIAMVHLLVPSFGFCVPASALSPERVAPQCPPPLPPQCPFFPAQTTVTTPISPLTVLPVTTTVTSTSEFSSTAVSSSS